MSPLKALNRTLLLMRDEIFDELPDELLFAALTDTSVVLVADQTNLKTHSAQTAYVTAAILLARSGHRVTLAAPNIELLRSQPPLDPGGLVDQLIACAPNILPGMSFATDHARRYDLALLFGDSAWCGEATHSVRLNATSWQARMTSAEVREPWSANDWPIGAMGAAAFGAAEAFKSAMRRLAFAALDPAVFTQLFYPTTVASMDLAPPNTAEKSSLGNIDFVSAGAINSSVLYALLRLPNLVGAARIIDDDIIDLTNLNRCMLFLLSEFKLAKADVLARFAPKTFSILPVVSRFERKVYVRLGRLSDAVLVGVDDIKARWDVQRAWPKWLGIGATTHFNSMASFHAEETPCAGCLHPKDDPTEGPIPTAAFVSFWAGLWLTSLYLRHLASDDYALEQHFYYSALRPENVWKGPIQRRSDCPVGCGSYHPSRHGRQAAARA